MNLETLNRYHEDGLLYKQTHPTLPLTIWNYSEKVQYEMLWDEVTIACRGLVTDDSGTVIAKPFPKFFNYEEVIDKIVIPWDSEYVYVQEKMDGSLGILFNYNGEWMLATRGSFTSDQAVKGLEILKSKYDLKRFIPNVTYLCEIIYPENRIVVNYNGEEMITFLGATTPEGELYWGTAKSMFIASGIAYEDIVWTAMDVLTEDLFKRYQNRNESDKEGFVIRFHPSNYRVKIKYEEYVRLHKIMTNFSTRNIWETLANGEDLMASLVDVPDEFHAKIRVYVDELTTQFQTIEKEYTWIFNTIVKGLEIHNVPKEKYRATFAQYALQYKHPSLLFTMLDKRDYGKIIWDLIYPEYRKL